MKQIQILPPAILKKQCPLSKSAQDFLMQSKKKANAIAAAVDPSKVFFIGPCSIHDIDSAICYAECFKKLRNTLNNRCFLVMRVHLQKPRTITGWKGLMYDPYLDGSNDIQTGIIWSRRLLTTLAEMHVPCATEWLDPLSSCFLSDLITWGFIGARTSSSQVHRELASSLYFPVGFKNHTDGSLEDAIHGVLSAKEKHTFMSINQEGVACAFQSAGNPHTHLVLRGSHQGINYDSKSIKTALKKLAAVNLPQRIIIDCAHDNCEKQFQKQKDVFQSVLEQISTGGHEILGIMIESHLKEGKQNLEASKLEFGLSITDPCLNWEATAELIYQANCVVC
ncbi:MAG TPA: 3-deoxy-7-phosphoheptulonate synthase [Candidatus Rhabdochlamydia sp.]|jgi:3-deoxy-7-phosphoheptulonate synthase|nr:3-deoxy-7-phosphoheptulonate synthase [Candidatus Rhabdochlamydia sp.]